MRFYRYYNFKKGEKMRKDSYIIALNCGNSRGYGRKVLENLGQLSLEVK